jgi:hypothetical protein
MIGHRAHAAAALLAVLALASSASAQVSRVGDTFTSIAAPTRGTAIAYDSRNNVYLVASTYGTLRGVFLNADGVAVSTPFVIQASGLYTHFPDIVYAPEADAGAGAFMVTWHESDAPITSVHARLVSYTRGIIGPDVVLAPNESWWEVQSEPSVAYSPASREFLVTWRTFLGYDVRAARLDLAGNLMGPPFSLTADGVSVYDQYPQAAYNPTTDEFVVGWSATVSSSVFKIQRIKAGTGQILGPAQTVGSAVTIYTTSISFNAATGGFLIAWYQDPPRQIYGRLLAADGTPTTPITPFSARYAAYDGLDVSRNPLSGTYFAVSHDLAVDTKEDGGVEIGSDGVPLSSGIQVTVSPPNTLGNFYPHLVANPTRAEWMVVTSRSFAATVNQRLFTATVGGQPPPPPPPPPPPTSSPIIMIDAPSNNTVIAQPFAIGGWAVDVASTTGTGINAIHVWAYPNPGSGTPPILLGAAAYGISRPDVGAALGSPRFNPSGYALTVNSLPIGVYDLVVFGYSTVANTFNAAKVVRVNIVPPPPDPRMFVDAPAPGQPDVSGNFVVAGWAIDVNASSGTGVDAVHVWAFPVAGGAPVFVGVAAYGVFRPDVAAAFGGRAQFNFSGFTLNVVAPTVPVGAQYDIVAFAHSTLTGTFNNAFVKRVNVR